MCVGLLITMETQSLDAGCWQPQTLSSALLEASSLCVSHWGCSNHRLDVLPLLLVEFLFSCSFFLWGLDTRQAGWTLLPAAPGCSLSPAEKQRLFFPAVCLAVLFLAILPQIFLLSSKLFSFASIICQRLFSNNCSLGSLSEVTLSRSTDQPVAAVFLSPHSL